MEIFEYRQCSVQQLRLKVKGKILLSLYARLVPRYIMKMIPNVIKLRPLSLRASSQTGAAIRFFKGF